MSRLTEGEYDPLALGRWTASLRRGIQGERGQKFLRELRDILVAMPEKRLIDDQWVTPQGEVCLLGAYLMAKDPMLSPEQSEFINDRYEGDIGPDIFAEKFNLPRCMCWDLEFRNDQRYMGPGWTDETPEQRYTRLLAHIEKLILPEVPA